jgi:hypothetical protein
VGGQVVDGSWVIALADRDVLPTDLNWEFLDAFGGVVSSGSGVTTPDN